MAHWRPRAPAQSLGILGARKPRRRRKKPGMILPRERDKSQCYSQGPGPGSPGSSQKAQSPNFRASFNLLSNPRQRGGRAVPRCLESGSPAQGAETELSKTNMCSLPQARSWSLNHPAPAAALEWVGGLAESCLASSATEWHSLTQVWFATPPFTTQRSPCSLTDGVKFFGGLLKASSRGGGKVRKTLTLPLST